MFMMRASLLAALVVVCACSSRSDPPLIKNIHRSGNHFEGPHWSPSENALYWVDITMQRVHRFDAESGNVTTREIAYGPVSLVVSVKDYPGVLVLAVGSELYMLKWSAPPGNSALRLLTAFDLGLPDNRANDGKADAKGRLWFGTIGKEVNEVLEKDQATLYMVDEHNYAQPEVKYRPVTASNGIAWTADNNYMFYIDTPTRNIDVFDFNLDTGSIRNRRTLFSFQSNNVTGYPDGMTIDSEGNLWVACYNGWKVIKVNSRSGKLLEQHKLPAQKVTSVMWGGRDLATLYVTTSRRGLNAAELAQQPEAGSLFAIEGTGAKGLPENQFVFPEASTY